MFVPYARRDDQKFFNRTQQRVEQALLRGDYDDIRAAYARLRVHCTARGVPLPALASAIAAHLAERE